MSYGQIPDSDHWAILTKETTYHAADQRSIDHPGHGYPAHTTEAIVYNWYATKEEFLRAAMRLRGQWYQPLKVTPVRVRIETVAEVD